MQVVSERKYLKKGLDLLVSAHNQGSNDLLGCVSIEEWNQSCVSVSSDIPMANVRSFPKDAENAPLCVQGVNRYIISIVVNCSPVPYALIALVLYLFHHEPIKIGRIIFHA